MKDDTTYLQHMLDAVHAIQEYTRPLSFDEFQDDDMRRDAVIRQIEILGEATKKLSEAIRSSTEDIPWQDIAGMRDRLIHGYFGVDTELVWETVQKDIPRLEEQLVELLEQEG